MGLIEVLLNREAEFGDRDDAAMDLAAYDDEQAEHALMSIAEDITVNKLLAERCAESLAEIWVRKKETQDNKIARLRHDVRQTAVTIMESLCSRTIWIP